MTRFSLTFFVLLAAVPAFAQQSDKSWYIVGGQAENGYAAAGALMVDGEQSCTGTLIAPTVVLTAAHCLEGSASSMSFYVGLDANKPSSGNVVGAKSIHPHPDYGKNEDADIGVMLLQSAPSGVEPIAPRLAPLPNIVGKKALFIGYGLTSANGSYGKKLSVEIAISKVEETHIFYEDPSKNTCNGDSGGPALMDLDGVTSVVGVTSYGDQDCTEFGANTRVDTFAQWVQQFMDGEAPAGSDQGTGGGSGGGTSDDGDFCEQEGWYGDGICDADCPKPDSDCAQGGEQTGGDDTGANGEDFCEQEGWYGDGICDADCPKPDSDCSEGGDDEPVDQEPTDDDGDLCEEEGWYGDGICDAGCPKPDSDCSDDGEVEPQTPADDSTDEPCDDEETHDTADYGKDIDADGMTDTSDADSAENGSTDSASKSASSSAAAPRSSQGAGCTATGRHGNAGGLALMLGLVLFGLVRTRSRSALVHADSSC